MFWEVYALTLTVIVVYLVYISLRLLKTKKSVEFDEIKAQKITIVEPNGKPVLIIANTKNFPPLMIDGKEYPGIRSGNIEEIGKGMIFYNNDGDEMGGFVWGSDKSEDEISQWAMFTIDGYKQNEVFRLLFDQTGNKKNISIIAYDQPGKSLKPVVEKLSKIVSIKDSAQREKERDKFNEWLKKEYPNTYRERFYIGYEDSISFIQLYDKEGKPKLRLYVDENGEPKLEFYDKKEK